LTALGDRDAEVRVAALSGLARRMGPETVPAALPLLHDAVAKVRAAIAK